MVEGCLKDVDEVVEESFWADWQNAKARGLNDALNFIQKTWATEKLFRSFSISKEMLDNLLRGKFKTINEYIYNNHKDQTEKDYIIFTYDMFDESTKKIFTIIDSVFINKSIKYDKKNTFFCSFFTFNRM